MIQYNNHRPTQDSGHGPWSRITFFVCSYEGAKEWAAQQGFDAVIVNHFDPNIVQPGDTVLGDLSINMAAVVCQRGGRYFHFTMEIPSYLIGQKITAKMMTELGAKLQEFEILQVPHTFWSIS